jgi:MoaA/NifB/PqqE/SkfB family radical SAM enzyme
VLGGFSAFSSPMRRLSFLNQLRSLRQTIAIGALLAPATGVRRLPYPFIMTFVVTRRCDSRCKMCNIWNDAIDSSPLSLEQIEGIFSRDDFSFVRSLTLTGGEPTLRADLPQLFRILIRRLRNLEHVLLATNGSCTDRTIECIEHMLDILDIEDNRVTHFNVQLSVDGVGEIHDAVRGIPGVFQRVKATLLGLQALQEHSPRLRLHLSCVLTPYNVFRLQPLREFAERANLRIHYAPVTFSKKYFNNVSQENALSFSAEGRDVAQQWFHWLSKADRTTYRFPYRDIARMLQGRSRSRRCMMGTYSFVLEYDGTVYPCFIGESADLGNLLIDLFDDVWFGRRAEQARRRLRTRFCPSCLAGCYPLPVNPLELAEMFCLYGIKFRPGEKHWSFKRG